MGCAQSRKKNEVLIQCKKREKFMEAAIFYWNALAAAHSGYATVLKNVGAALTDYSRDLIEDDLPSQGKPPSILESHDGNMVANIFNDLDEHFIEASHGANQVLEILNAPRRDFAKKTDYLAQVMRAITWNNDSSEGVTDDEWETHAAILEWEERLYDEVKAFEKVKIEYHKKAASRNVKQKKSTEKDKIEAAISYSHTRYIVGIESVDSIVAEINHLRNYRLYPKLVNLIDRMAKMWEAMHTQHNAQLTIVRDRLRAALDSSSTTKETSQLHRERTALLLSVLRGWQSQFQKLISHQKKYVEALYNWLKLNLRCNSKEGAPLVPIQALLEAWKDEMEKLPDKLGEESIKGMSELVRMITIHQEEELRLREKCERTRKNCRPKVMNSGKDMVEWNNLPVSSKRRLDREVETYEEMRKLVKVKSVESFTAHLEQLFHGMSDFALACSLMYNKLSSLSKSQSPLVE